MSDEEGDVKLTPHQALIRQKEIENGKLEMQRRIGALRQQVSKFDAIDYRRAQLAYEHKQAKQFREQIREEEAMLAEMKKDYHEQNVELVNAIKVNVKEGLLNSTQTLKKEKAALSNSRKEESAKNMEDIEAYLEDETDWKKELRGRIREVQQEQAARRQTFFKNRTQNIKKEKESFVKAAAKEYDEETKQIADLILKEARVIRQLIKLRESHAEKEDGKKSEDNKDTKEAA